MDKNDIVTGIKLIDIGHIEPNTGQISGLPANPREIAPEKFELLKKDIQEYPEFLNINALKVYPIDGGRYVTIGGNMRYLALKELGYEKVPCVIIPKETSTESLKAYVVLDNSNFGQWDWAKLSSEEWDAAQLAEWGVECDFIGDDIDYIDDINEGGLKALAKSEVDVFAVTLNIPKQYKELFDEYIKVKGKQDIINTIISVICPDAEAK